MGQEISATLIEESKTTADFGQLDVNSIKFRINGKQYAVSEKIPAGTTLNTFIRDVVCLKGTKVMCREGGCGSCIVAAEINGKLLAVNSCLVPVFICNEWNVTTIEGIGGRKDGYHTIQATLAEMNGSQCGYCSTGMVMNMFSLIQNGKITMKDVENSFGGSLCRCTGYRPILDAFKSFASDANPSMQKKIQDIEELHRINKACRRCPRQKCSGFCKDVEIIENPCDLKNLKLKFKDFDFYKVLTIEEIFSILNENQEKSYILNGGNTSYGK